MLTEPFGISTTYSAIRFHANTLKVKTVLDKKISELRMGKTLFKVACDLDSGARLPFMGKKDFEDYRQVEEKVEAVDLKYPIKIEVANNRYEYCRLCTLVDLVIPFEGSFIKLENVIVYIVDGNWGRFLLSWPILHTLGLSPESNLHKLKGKVVKLTWEEQLPVALDEEAMSREAVQVDCVRLLSALRAGIISSEDAERNLELLNLVESDSKNGGFVLLNGDCDYKTEELKALYGNFRAKETIQEKGTNFVLNPLADYRDKLPRTKKHYSLPKEEYVRRKFRRDRSYTASSVKFQNGDVIAENDPQHEDATFSETGILEVPDKINFEAELEVALEEAKAKGCGDIDRLREILVKHKNIFAFNFDDCEISKLTPMKPELKAGADPVYAKPRRMSLDQLQWLENHISKMIQLGMLKPVRNPVWGVPVFIVPKPGNKGYRMVADFREVNSRCLMNSLPMPLLESMIAATKGSKFFGSLDNMKGFNLLGVEDSEPFTLVTPFGCFQMMVAPQGYLNSPIVYQDRIVNEVLKDLHMKSCINWIDDCFVFGEAESEYLDRLDIILGRYGDYNVKLNFKKCTFFAQELTWCGRTFSENGYCYDSKFYDKILETPEPVLAQELHDFVFALGWIQDSLNPHEVLGAKEVLSNFLNKLFDEVKISSGSSSRKKKKIVGMKLKDLGWSERESNAFKKCLELVHRAIKKALLILIKCYAYLQTRQRSVAV